MRANYISTIELRDRIFSLVAANPAAGGAAVRARLNRAGGVPAFAAVAAALGDAYCRHVFDAVSPRQWREIEAAAPAAPADAEALQEFYGSLLAVAMDWTPAKDLEPFFAEARTRPAGELIAAFVAVDVSEIACLAAFWTPEEMDRILACLSRDARMQVVLRATRLDRLPEEVVLRTARRVAERACASFRVRERTALAAEAATYETVTREAPAPAPAPVASADAGIPTIYVQDGRVADAIERIHRLVNESPVEARILDFLAEESPALYRKLRRPTPARGANDETPARDASL